MKRYALCGLSSRALENFVRPLWGSLPQDEPREDGRPDFSSRAQLVAVLDPDAQRVQQFNALARAAGRSEVQHHAPEGVERMLDETRPDALLIASPDATHARYILAGLRRGLEVITEKPMTATAAQAAAVLVAAERSSGVLRVAHNFRYVPRHQQLKRLIAGGAVGRVVRATLDYHVDTSHGASYFLRWNRRRAMSGGLSVHKSCHHLDLMNWLLDDEPATVYALGGLNFYGPNGPHRPKDEHGRPASDERAADPYYRAQQGSGAFPEDEGSARSGAHGLTYAHQYPATDRSYLYDDEIDIEDTYTSAVAYRGGASLAYTIDFSSPWEGYAMEIVGTHGTLELCHGVERDGRLRPGDDFITHHPLFGRKQLHPVARADGGHSGADQLLQEDLFGDGLRGSPELGLAATPRQAAVAVAAGEAMWRSVATGAPIAVAGLLDGGPSTDREPAPCC
jgi:predicted dehydrogenase